MALSSTEEAQTRALIAQQAAILSLASSEPTIISKLAATKVSLADLTAATSLGASDLFLVRQGTTEKSTALSVLTPDASENVKGIVELATSEETLTGTDNTRAVHPSGLMSGFVKSLAANGYQKLPSGLIIQWGNVSTNSSGFASVTFPIAFTSNVFSAFATATNSVAGNALANIGAFTNTTLSIYGTNGASGSPGIAGILNLNWLAIGR